MQFLLYSPLVVAIVYGLPLPDGSVNSPAEAVRKFDQVFIGGNAEAEDGFPLVTDERKKREADVQAQEVIRSKVLISSDRFYGNAEAEDGFPLVSEEKRKRRETQDNTEALEVRQPNRQININADFENGFPLWSDEKRKKRAGAEFPANEIAVLKFAPFKFDIDNEDGVGHAIDEQKR